MIGSFRVVDFHLHVGTRQHWNPWVIDFFHEVNPFYRDNFTEAVTAGGIIAYLRTQAVDRAIVLSEYAPASTGVVTNEFTSAFCEGHPELIPFGSVCLYDGVPLADQARRAVVDLGMKGFKMLPTYAHFFPDDPALFPFYETAESLGVPVMFHTGISLFRGSRVKFGDPILLDEVADRFPRLRIVMEHGGRSFWWDKAAWMITRHRNVSIGLAGIPAKHLLRLFPHVERYADRFIFGSDWPGVPDIKPLAEKIAELPLSDGAKERILAGNAEEMLGLA